ncbi:MAG: PAS domain-containing protein [Halohasta sp.]
MLTHPQNTQMICDDSGPASSPEVGSEAVGAVFHALSDAVVVSDATGRIQYANPAACTRYGEDLIGKTLDSLVDDVLAEDPLVDRLHRAAEADGRSGGGDDRGLAWTVRTADGDLLRERLHPTATTVDGEPALIVVARDSEPVDETGSDRFVDQRRAAAYLETAQTVANIGWWYKSIPDDRIDWSEMVASMWDVDAETVDHETFLGCLHPDDRDRVDAAWAAALQGEPYDVEHRIVTDDGETKWMRQQAELVFEDGEAVSATGVVQEITAQKQREAELTRLRTQFEQFAGVVRDAFFLVSADYSETLFVNDAVERIYGITPAEAASDPESWLRHVHPDDKGDLLTAVEEFRAGTVTGMLSQRCRIQHPERGLRWIEAQIDVVTDDEGTVTHIAGITTDITERKQRERELEAATHRLTLALEGTDTGVWEWDLETDEVVWTSSMEHLFGVDPGTFEGTYEAFAGYVHPDDRSTLETAIEHTVNTGEALQTEYRIRTADDRLLWGEARAELVDDGSGGQRLVGIVTDVTERKDRERELRRNRDLIEQTQENAAIGWWEVDFLAESLHWSNEVYRIHDLPADHEVTVADGIGFYHPDDRQTIQAAFDRLTTEGEPYDLELRIVTAEDRTRWVRTVADPQVDADGEIVGALGIFQDITDRKRYETELERAQTELRQIIDLIPDPVFVKNRAGEYLLANEALADCYGETPATVEGRHESAVMPDASQSDGFREDDLAVIDSGEPKQIPEESLTTVDGGTRILSTIKIPYETADNHEPAVLAYARDITDLKAYERQLETQRDNLDVLNQVVRHDIRNDLQLIAAYAAMLDGELDAEAQSHLDVIARSADNAVELTTTARDLAETMLQADANRRPVPLARTLDGQIDRLLSAEPSTVVNVTGDLPRVHVLADDLLEAVFRNILKNAVQHNDTEEPEIAIEAAVDDHSATVRIADNGPGVSDAHKTQIFGRGEQGLNSSGTGIGLYLVDTLVDRYGGTVTVEDNEPRGAVFVVALPLAG